MSRCDLMTIGAEILNKCRVAAESDKFEQVGKAFVEILDSCDTRTLAKMLVAQYGLSMAALAQFVCTHASFKDKVIVSDILNISTTNASAAIRIFHNVKGKLAERSKELSSFELDASCYYNDFIVLDRLESFGPGAGANLVRALQRKVTVPIVLQAGFLHYGDYDSFYESNDFSVVDRLVNYYKELGFRDANAEIGQCEESVVMVWEGDNQWKSPQENLKVF